MPDVKIVITNTILNLSTITRTILWSFKVSLFYSKNQREGDRGHLIFFWCCYITVDSAMAASQNGFCSYTLSFHKKTNIMQIVTINISIFNYLIFYHRETRLFYDPFFELCKHRFVTQPLQNPQFCSSTIFSGGGGGICHKYHDYSTIHSCFY
jgi:hypothetical protein